jgi:hypothetical protein
MDYSMPATGRPDNIGNISWCKSVAERVGSENQIPGFIDQTLPAHRIGGKLFLKYKLLIFRNMEKISNRLF